MIINDFPREYQTRSSQYASAESEIKSDKWMGNLGWRWYPSDATHLRERIVGSRTSLAQQMYTPNRTKTRTSQDHYRRISKLPRDFFGRIYVNNSAKQSIKVIK